MANILLQKLSKYKAWPMNLMRELSSTCSASPVGLQSVNCGLCSGMQNMSASHPLTHSAERWVKRKLSVSRHLYFEPSLLDPKSKHAPTMGVTSVVANTVKCAVLRSMQLLLLRKVQTSDHGALKDMCPQSTAALSQRTEMAQSAAIFSGFKLGQSTYKPKYQRDSKARRFRAATPRYCKFQ